MLKKQYRDTNYFVTEDGKVFRGERQLKPYRQSKGYLRVDVWYEKQKTVTYAHRMIAETFLPNTKNHCCINHKDGNKANNNISNLEWVSNSENIHHRQEVLRVGVNEKHSKTKIPTFVVKYLRWAKENGYPISRDRFMEKYRISKGHFYKILRGDVRKWVD